jgi:hypothetical protein
MSVSSRLTPDFLPEKPSIHGLAFLFSSIPFCFEKEKAHVVEPFSTLKYLIADSPIF